MWKSYSSTQLYTYAYTYTYMHTLHTNTRPCQAHAPPSPPTHHHIHRWLFRSTLPQRYECVCCMWHHITQQVPGLLSSMISIQHEHQGGRVQCGVGMGGSVGGAEGGKPFLKGRDPCMGSAPHDEDTTLGGGGGKGECVCVWVKQGPMWDGLMQGAPSATSLQNPQQKYRKTKNTYTLYLGYNCTRDGCSISSAFYKYGACERGGIGSITPCTRMRYCMSVLDRGWPPPLYNTWCTLQYALAQCFFFCLLWVWCSGGGWA